MEGPNFLSSLSVPKVYDLIAAAGHDVLSIRRKGDTVDDCTLRSSPDLGPSGSNVENPDAMLPKHFAGSKRHAGSSTTEAIAGGRAVDGRQRGNPSGYHPQGDALVGASGHNRHAIEEGDAPNVVSVALESTYLRASAEVPNANHMVLPAISSPGCRKVPILRHRYAANPFGVADEALDLTRWIYTSTAWRL